ncbi:MAG TPA: hypothetical protein VFJ82_24070 [Longimicrobium sp.]|nr:hypothetical protein [Longimicrobium sp.]
MVHSHAHGGALSRYAAAALIIAACRGSQEPLPELRPGSVAPPALAASSPTAIRATWALDGRELIRCRNSARELRRLQARFGDRIEIAAVAFDSDPASVESFLRSERVRARVLYLTTPARQAARGVKRPALYIVRGERIAAVFLGVPLDDTRSIQARDVESRVASLLGGSGAGGRAGIHPSS